MKLKTLIVATSAVLFGLTSQAFAAPLKIGVVPGAYADSIAVAAKEAKAQGLDVQLVEFTDWTTPNVALNSGDIDANYFQHQPFLDNAIANKASSSRAQARAFWPTSGCIHSSTKRSAMCP